ncbi:MAG: group II intron reverse transcriptase/maturase [bacterium]|nr:group II intron reverse transcriptase/maturase [bacterium]
MARIGRQARQEAAKREKDKEKVTNLFSHMRVDLLEAAFRRLRKNAAAGVDGVSWDDYAKGLGARLADLQDRLHRGAYVPQPVRRHYIPKADGRKRPLGIPAIEDKIVQGAVVTLLTPIYEAEFEDCSYGFRPRRNQHMALEAVDTMMYQGKVSWVLDADIQGFFDKISHEWLIRFLEHRIGDVRLIRLIHRWLKAGVMEDLVLRETTEGTPQGGLISPLLANVYLHYVLDLWVGQWARQVPRDVHLVRYADDFIVGFQWRRDAIAFRWQLERRLAKFGLTLHPAKTRMLRFGRYARRSCGDDGRRKPESFEFLGFTHISGERENGKFLMIRITSRKRRQAKLAELKLELRRRISMPVQDQWEWLATVLRGYFQYHGVPTNSRTLWAFRRRVTAIWHKTLQRRSHKAGMTRHSLALHDQRFPLPRPRIVHGRQMQLVGR